MATLAEWKVIVREADASLNKIVNGVTIALTDAEYNATMDSWAQAKYNREIEEAIRTDGGASSNYAMFRLEAYPSVGDQLDMQYKDAVNGTTTWKDAIAAIKAKYTKA
jgi:hypothetical protein|tara:strand:- start:53 stop:376 length:324 start_codon:yes stop_codon:yes gene_type:complete